MDVQLTVEQNNLITSIAENEGFNEFDITTSSGSSKGDNYMGVITKVSVKNHHRKLELIMKTAPTNTKLRDIIPVRMGFLREITVYETIFPAFERFLKEEGCPSGIPTHAKIYGSCNKEFQESVIFENLKEIGYDLWDRKKPMNWDHIVLVLQEYGKLHAVSLAMKEKNPKLYERLTEDMENLYIKMYEGDDETKRKKMEDAKKFVGVGIKALKGHQSAMEALERFSLTAYEYMNKDIAMKEDALVFLHGDCWCNNILFKYEDPTTKTPSKACLIDWQLSWTGSPAMDLAYFLFTCAPKEILADYEKCLRIYHEAACETLTSIGCDPEILYPLSLLENHWRKYVKYGIYMATMLLKVMLSEGDEIPDMSEMADSGMNFAEEFNYDSVHDDSYKGRILDIVTVCLENDWL